MRTAPVAVRNFLAANNAFVRADLITLTLADGSTTFRWTTADVSLTVSAVTYNAYSEVGTPLGPVVRRGAYRQSIGLVVDTLDLWLAGPRYLIGGLTLGQRGFAGYFDGARLRIDHLIMPTPGDVSLGAIPSWFEGRVAQVEPRGPGVSLRCKSELEALNKIVPRFMIQPACGNAVYDVNCTLVKATFTLAGTVSAATTKTVTTASAALTAKASGYFNLGVLSVTSGGTVYKRAISGWTGTVFTLQTPLPITPGVGDVLSVYPGCDKQRGTCNTKFANLSHYRGYPHAPAAEAGSK